MLKFILIEHRDGNDPARVSVCDTEKERERATLAAIYGEAENAPHDLSLEGLRKDGWMRFEGDPPLQWVTADSKPRTRT